MATTAYEQLFGTSFSGDPIAKRVFSIMSINSYTPCPHGCSRIVRKLPMRQQVDKWNYNRVCTAFEDANAKILNLDLQIETVAMADHVQYQRYASFKPITERATIYNVNNLQRPFITLGEHMDEDGIDSFVGHNITVTHNEDDIERMQFYIKRLSHQTGALSSLNLRAQLSQFGPTEFTWDFDNCCCAELAAEVHRFAHSTLQSSRLFRTRGVPPSCLAVYPHFNFSPVHNIGFTNYHEPQWVTQFMVEPAWPNHLTYIPPMKNPCKTYVPLRIPFRDGKQKPASHWSWSQRCRDGYVQTSQNQSALDHAFNLECPQMEYELDVIDNYQIWAPDDPVDPAWGHPLQAQMGIGSMASKASTTMDSMTNLLTASETTRTMMVDTLTESREVMGNINSFVTEARSSLEAVTSFLRGVGFVGECIDFAVWVTDVAIAIFSGSKQSIPTLVIRLLSLCGAAQAAIKLVMNIVSDYVASIPDEPNNRDPSDHPLSAQAAVTGSLENIIVLVFATICGVSLTPGLRTRLLAVVRLYPFLTKVIDKTPDTLRQILTSLPKIVQELAARILPEEWLRTRMSQSDVRAWIIEAVEFEPYRERHAAVTTSPALSAKVIEVYESGVKILADIAFKTDVIPMMPTFNNLFRNIAAIRGVVEKLGTTTPNRVTPFCLQLQSEPGKGKTTLVRALAAAVAPPGVYNNDNLVYTRSTLVGIDANWDGFPARNFCVNLEDFGSTTDVGEFLQFQQLASSSAFPIPRAHLSAKETFCTSPLILVTSNKPYPPCNNHNTMTAIYRRRNILVEVDVKPFFQNKDGGLDATKVEVALLTGHAPWDFWTFSLMDPISSAVPNGPLLSYDEFVEHFQKEFDLHHVRQEALRVRQELILGTKSTDYRAPRVSAPEMVAQMDDGFSADEMVPDFVARFVNGPEPEVNLQFWTDHLAELPAVADPVLTRLKKMGSGMTENAYAFATKNIKVIGALAGSAAMVSALLAGVWALSRGSKSSAQGGSMASSLMSGHVNARRTVKYTTQSSNWNNAEVDQEREFIAAHLRRISYTSRAKQERSVNCVMLGGKKLLLPCHFLDGIDYDLPFSVFSTTQETPYVFLADPINVVADHQADIAIIRVPAMRSYREVRDKFLLTKDLNNVDLMDSALIIMAKNATVNHFMVQPSRITSKGSLTYGPLNANSEDYEIQSGWKYVAATQNGDCGGILMCNDGNVRGKILGIHAASATVGRTRYAQLVTKEMIDKLDTLPSDTGAMIFPKNLSAQVGLIDVSGGSLTELGSLPKKDAFRVPTSTDITESFLHGKITEPITGPAVLTPKDPRLTVKHSVLAKSLKKFGLPLMPMPLDLLNQAAADVKRELEEFLGGRKLPVLSEFDAINGSPEWSLKSMGMDVSPGYPYVKTRPMGMQGCLYLFDVNDDLKSVKSQILRWDLTGRLEAAKNYERFPTLWIDNLKDERRPLLKIAAGKTRSFTYPPIDYRILCRQYMGAFSGFCTQNPVESFCAVGIDSTGFQWTELAWKLLAKGNNIFGGDFSAWDGTIHSQMMVILTDIINSLYDGTDEENRIRTVLIDEWTHVVHLAINSVYLSHQGNPSGTPLTITINTIVHAIYMRVAFLALLPEYHDLYHFHQLVAETYVGDDDLLSVSDKICDRFNIGTISKYFAQFGITYTTADKLEAADETFTTLANSVFLKSGFRKEGPFWKCTLDIDVIYEMMNWTKKGLDRLEGTAMNIQSALRHAYFHGREVFKALRESINLALRREGMRLDGALTYDVIEAWYRSKTGSGDYTDIAFDNIPRLLPI